MSLAVKTDRKSQKHAKFSLTETIRKYVQTKELETNAIPTFDKSGTISLEIFLDKVLDIHSLLSINFQFCIFVTGMIAPKYTQDDLRHHGDSEEEHQRLRGIFNEIRARAKSNQPIAVIESEFFCSNLYMLKEEKVSSYSICDDWRFKWLFYRYWYDLDGTSAHEYVDGLGKAKPSSAQIDSDLKNLQLFADNWFQLVQDNTIASDGLKDAAKETRDELKALDKEPEFNEYGFLRQSFRYERFKLALLLRLKFAYLISEEIFAKHGSPEIVFTLNGEQLIFNKYSCIHIINRHYAKDQKVVNRNKSFHDTIMPPRELPEILSHIIQTIDASGAYIGQDHKKVYLRYKGYDFALWSEVKYKQQKGIKGNIGFNRIQTFYPVELNSELNTLKTEYSIIKLTDDLSVYTKNP